MSKKPLKNGEKKDERDEKGRFKKGYSGGPGRPRGSISLTEKIKQRLQDLTPDQKKTFLEALADKILKGAFEGDTMIQKLIWNYLDGMPKQAMELEHKGGILIEDWGRALGSLLKDTDEKTKEEFEKICGQFERLIERLKGSKGGS